MSGFFPALFNLSDLSGDSTPSGFKLIGEAEGDSSGFSVSGAGDVNDDGINDIIIGTKDTSKTYVVFGGYKVGALGSLALSVLDGQNGFTLIENEEDHSVTAVDSAGDINGDGIADMIIGIPHTTHSDGKSYVVFGNSGIGVGGGFALSTLNGRNGFVLLGETDGAGLSGFSVSRAGDVNDDGIDDIIIGAPSLSFGSGKSYVVFGDPNVGRNGSFMLAALNGQNGFVLMGEEEDYSGTSVSEAGDINEDGIDDLIIGAPGTGKSYIVFGSRTVGSNGSLTLANLGGENGFILVGEKIQDESGTSVSSAGDLNDDGIKDVIIGAPGASKSYVVFGGRHLNSGNNFLLSTLNGQNGFIVSGEEDQSGFSVRAAGDINQDGVDDLIIGAPKASKSYVVFGGSNVGKNGSFMLSTLNGQNGFVLMGETGEDEEADETGYSVGALGDVNGDGREDIIVGSPYATVKNIAASGKSYVLFGMPPLMPPPSVESSSDRSSFLPALIMGSFTLLLGILVFGSLGFKMWRRYQGNRLIQPNIEVEEVEEALQYTASAELAPLVSVTSPEAISQTATTEVQPREQSLNKTVPPAL